MATNKVPLYPFGLDITGRLDGQTDGKVGTTLVFGSNQELISRLDELKDYTFVTSEEDDILSNELFDNGYLTEANGTFKVAQQ